MDNSQARPLELSGCSEPLAISYSSDENQKSSDHSSDADSQAPNASLDGASIEAIAGSVTVSLDTTTIGTPPANVSLDTTTMDGPRAAPDDKGKEEADAPEARECLVPVQVEGASSTVQPAKGGSASLAIDVTKAGSANLGPFNLTDEVIRTTLAFFLPDAQARAFWSLHFFYEARVTWKDFVGATMSWCCPGISTSDAANLLVFMSQLAGGKVNRDLQIEPPDYISFEAFGTITYFFPWRAQSEMAGLLRDLLFLARSSWFMGAMPYDEAHAKLSGQPKGSFLIRLGQGAARGELSVSRVVDPMTVLHSRLHWNAAENTWAFTHAQPLVEGNLLSLVSDSASGPLPFASPRSAADTVRSMREAVEKRNRLKRMAASRDSDKKKKSQSEATAATLKEEEALDQKELEYLKRIEEHKNAMGVAPVSPRPLKDWVQKNSKVLNMLAACPGSPFALVLNYMAPSPMMDL